jgi:ribonuclease HII
MKYPNFNEEKKLWKKGYKFVIGLDEAGRGPLAGPGVAAAVCIRKLQIPSTHNSSRSRMIMRAKILKQVKDSKQLSSEKREEIYNALIKHPDIVWGIGIVSEKIIDKINILEATKLAMKKSIKNLEKDFLILDGNFKLDIDIPQKSIIKSDQKGFSVAAASIIAKVTRDRIMRKEHKKYPEYGFDKHKGYPTKAHFANLQEFGPCKIHRKTFYPVKTLRG